MLCIVPVRVRRMQQRGADGRKARRQRGMRIIGGRLRGRKLNPVKAAGIRPTADRLREALFNIIAEHVAGAHVLDLFAGTGALAIEALSRGARRALLVDNSRDALSLMTRNLHLCGVWHSARVMRWDVCRNLNCLTEVECKFNLAFMDPPYNKGMLEPALVSLAQSRCLNDGALVLVEHSPREVPRADMAGFDELQQRRYGTSRISLLGWRR